MSAASGALAASLGWTATGVVVASYFFKRADLLRVVQMVGAALWMLYGLLIGAVPVVVANVLVLAAAAWTIRAARQPVSRPKVSEEQGSASPRPPPGLAT